MPSQITSSHYMLAVKSTVTTVQLQECRNQLIGKCLLHYKEDEEQKSYELHLVFESAAMSHLYLTSMFFPHLLVQQNEKQKLG